MITVNEKLLHMLCLRHLSIGALTNHSAYNLIMTAQLPFPQNPNYIFSQSQE